MGCPISRYFYGKSDYCPLPAPTILDKSMSLRLLTKSLFGHKNTKNDSLWPNLYLESTRFFFFFANLIFCWMLKILTHHFWIRSVPEPRSMFVSSSERMSNLRVLKSSFPRTKTQFTLCDLKRVSSWHFLQLKLFHTWLNVYNLSLK